VQRRSVSTKTAQAQHTRRDREGERGRDREAHTRTQTHARAHTGRRAIWGQQRQRTEAALPATPKAPPPPMVTSSKSWSLTPAALRVVASASGRPLKVTWNLRRPRVCGGADGRASGRLVGYLCRFCGHNQARARRCSLPSTFQLPVLIESVLRSFFTWAPGPTESSEATRDLMVETAVSPDTCIERKFWRVRSFRKDVKKEIRALHVRALGLGARTAQPI